MPQISDSGELDGAVAQVIADNPDAAEKIREGNLKTIGFLMGQVMKATRGKANPQLVQELIKKQLAAFEDGQYCDPICEFSIQISDALTVYLS